MTYNITASKNGQRYRILTKASTFGQAKNKIYAKGYYPLYGEKSMEDIEGTRISKINQFGNSELRLTV